MSDQKRGKKRPKSYYIKCAAGGKKPRRSNVMSPGMKGFLVTCNKYERETVREMYNLLNEYADNMYGPEQNDSAEKSGDDSNNESEEEDMEKALAKETAALKQDSTKERRFQNTSTKCNNVIFVRTNVDDPCGLAHSIFQDIYDKQVQKARYALRMLPVEAICNPGNKDIETTLTTVLAPHFETDFGVGIKYTAACKIRNNNRVSKNTILTTLGKIIKEMNPQHQLCHDEPDVVIIVEVVQKVCCFSVVKDYFKFKKYNLHEIVKKPSVDDVKQENDEDHDEVHEETVDTEELNKNIEKTKADVDTENDIKKEENETTENVEKDNNIKKEVTEGMNSVETSGDIENDIKKEVTETTDNVDKNTEIKKEVCETKKEVTETMDSVETSEDVDKDIEIKKEQQTM